MPAKPLKLVACAPQVDHPARTEVVGPAVVRVPHEDQPIAVGIGQRPQQRRVDRAEDGGVGADAERRGSGRRRP